MLGQIILCHWELSCAFWIPGLYSPDASSTPPRLTSQNVYSHYQMSHAVGIEENCPHVENHCSTVKSKVRILPNCQNPISNVPIHVFSAVSEHCIFLRLCFLVFYTTLTCYLRSRPQLSCLLVFSPLNTLKVTEISVVQYLVLYFLPCFQMNISLNLFYCLSHIKRAGHFPLFNIWDILIPEIGRGQSYFAWARGLVFLCSQEGRRQEWGKKTESWSCILWL